MTRRRLNRRRFSSVLPLIVGPSTLLTAGDMSPRAELGATGSRASAAASPASSLAPAPFPLSRAELGRRGSAKLEYANLAAGGSLTLLDLKTGPGYVSHLWCAIYCTDGIGRGLTRYRVTVDGETTPGVESTLVGYHAADANPNQSFATRYLGYSHQDALDGYYSYLPIPFRSSIKIEVVSGSAAAATFFGIADYHLGDFAWGRAAKLHTFEQEVTVSAYAWQDLLNVDNALSGVLGGVYSRLQGGDRTWNFLEGNVQVLTDGASDPIYESSGTEDYFNNAWYFQTGVIFADQSGCTCYDPSRSTVGAYRFHLDDPIPFDRALRVRWQNGNSDEARVTNPTNVRSHVWYYTAT